MSPIHLLCYALFYFFLLIKTSNWDSKPLNTTEFQSITVSSLSLTAAGFLRHSRTIAPEQSPKQLPPLNASKQSSLLQFQSLESKRHFSPLANVSIKREIHEKFVPFQTVQIQCSQTGMKKAFSDSRFVSRLTVVVYHQSNSLTNLSKVKKSVQVDSADWSRTSRRTSRRTIRQTTRRMIYRMTYLSNRLNWWSGERENSRRFYFIRKTNFESRGRALCSPKQLGD